MSHRLIFIASFRRSTLSGRNGTVSRRHLAVRGLPNTSFHGPLALPSIARDIRPAAMSTRVTIPPTQLGAPGKGAEARLSSSSQPR